MLWGGIKLLVAQYKTLADEWDYLDHRYYYSEEAPIYLHSMDENDKHLQ